MSTQVPAVRDFGSSLLDEKMQQHLGKLLPPDVSLDRFTRTTIVAIQHNPDVLGADRQSLYNAISRAASDGLMPDGKEGALVVYRSKNGQVARWMPMVEGIIKQMGKAGINAYAASVYENDDIDIWNDDGGQHVKHKPQPFKPRGTFVGVFACATVGSTVYVETLNLAEIDQIRASSRATGESPWVNWYERMAQKSVLHRIKKRVPIIEPDIIDSLRDPEEDPDTVIATQTQEAQAPTVDKDTGEVLHPEKRRPRGLQAVVDQPAPVMPDLRKSVSSTPPPPPVDTEDDVF